MLLTASLLATSWLPAAPTAFPAFLEDDDAAQAIAEDVEILRRLLVRALDGRGESVSATLDPAHARPVTPWGTVLRAETGLSAELGFRAATGWKRGASHVERSRGFHVPRTGVVYAIDVSVPVERVAAGETEPESPQEAARDEWEAMEEAVRRGDDEGAGGALEIVTSIVSGTNVTIDVPQALRLDEGAITDCIDAVLATLAEHGARVEGLGPAESITVCLHVQGRVTPGELWVNPVTSDLDADGTLDLLVHNVTDGYRTWGAGSAGELVLEQRIVLQLDRSALLELATRKAPGADAGGLALVHRY